MVTTRSFSQRLQRWPALLRSQTLGAFSPVATLTTYTPGPRALLEEAAREAERGLHLVRGFLLAVILTIGFVSLDLPPFIRPLMAILGVPLVVTFWLLVWRALRRQRAPRWLPYALVAFDAWLALRGPVAVQTGLFRAVGFDRYLTSEDLAAIGSVLLVLVAISGAFRLDPRVAVFSSVLAMASYVYVAVALRVAPNQALLV